jgi:hypothetical protein
MSNMKMFGHIFKKNSNMVYKVGDLLKIKGANDILVFTEGECETWEFAKPGSCFLLCDINPKKKDEFKLISQTTKSTSCWSAWAIDETFEKI